MFSAILGLASAGVGLYQAIGAQNIANQELVLKRQALKEQADQGKRQYGLALDQLQLEREQERYIREQNEANRIAQAVERAKMESDRRARLAQSQKERQYMIDRQVSIDRAAAQKYALELEAYLANQNLAKEERKLALQYLENARAVAAGEREEDIRRLYEDQLKATQERDFAIQELRAAQTIAVNERNMDVDYRNAILTDLAEMQAKVEASYNDFGPLAKPRTISDAEMMATFADFDRNAVANVDRAADRVASQTEAALLDRGIGNSSPANAARAEVARRLSLDYENARLNARNQAMDYISGKQDVYLRDYEAQRDARNTEMATVSSMYAPFIEGAINLRPTQSANDYSTPVNISSAIMDRALLSANQYAAPINIGSAMISPALSSLIGDTLTPPSTADAYQITGDYNQFTPALWNLTGPNGFASNAASLIGSVHQGYDPLGHFNRADKLFGSAAYALGGAANDLSKSFGSRTTASGAPAGGATAQLPMYGPMPTPRPANSYNHR